MIQIGITSILTLICCIIMCTLACLIKSKPSDRGAIQNKHLVKTSRVRMYLSAINMGCMTTAVFIILLSYFTPKIFNYCCCRLMFILAIAFYVVGSYALKFCFLLHFHLVYIILNYKLNKVSKSYSIAPEGMLQKDSYKIMVVVMIILSIISAVLVGLFSEGKCLTDNKYGCDVTFDRFTGWVAIGILSIDIISLSLFMYSVFRQLKAQNKTAVNAIKIKRFLSHWTFIVIALTTAVIDISINMAYPSYETLVLFLIDCTVYMICNLVAFTPTGSFIVMDSCHDVVV
eukprot:180964_1